MVGRSSQASWETRSMMDRMDPPGVTPSDADLDYQTWNVWGTDYNMREDAERILNIHPSLLPALIGFTMDIALPI